VTDADGIAVLSFTQAQAAARSWFAKMARDDAGIFAAAPFTVSQALDEYLADYRRRGGKTVKDTETRVDAFIKPPLGNVLVAKLTTQRLREWHAALAAAPARLRTGKKAKKRNERPMSPEDTDAIRRRRSTANRTLTVLKAALNHAFREGRIESDDAWRRLKPFRETDAAKVLYLTHAEATGISSATAAEFRPMVQCALLTGCRYGEIAALRVSDFDAEAGTVTVRTAKGGKSRHVVLTDDGITLFNQHTAEKPGTALVFARPKGEAWGKSHQHRLLKDACLRAKIEPPASFHILRHTYASHLVMAGAPLQVVAANLGHADTRMTEKHYAHLAPSYVATVIRAAMPNLKLVDPS
jgi:integrase